MPGVAELHDDDKDTVGRLARQLHVLALGHFHDLRILLGLIPQLHFEALLATGIFLFAKRMLEVVAGAVRAVVLLAGYQGRVVGNGRDAGGEKRQQRK